MRPSLAIDSFLEQIRVLPFVKGLDFSQKNRGREPRTDGILKLRTPNGIYAFLVENKRSYLDRGMVNALISHAKLNAKRRPEQLLLPARFVPKPSAERLVESGVNFPDQAGNMHLVLGRNFERTIIGNKEKIYEVAAWPTPS